MAPSSPAADAWTGRLVGGRWRIVSLLDDSGGMASVYLARDERLERQAVVKMPKASHLNEEFAERFAREAKWHAKVENLHVVHILDRGEEAGTPFLVLQYLPGGNLKAWCERSPSILSDPRLHYEAWLLPIAQALDAVAAQEIVHRDVKPSNILFDAAGQAYLSDFGIVKAGNDATMTGTGMFIGTLQFMSPEQCQNERVSLDGRSDQFGLAVTVYQVLTGWKYPTADDTAVVYAAKFGYTPMTQAVDHDPRIPQAVNDAVMRALSSDRDKRFASSVEFAQAVLEGFAGAARPSRSTAATGSTGDAPSAPPQKRQPLPVEVIPQPPPPTERPSAAVVDTVAHERRPAADGGAASLEPGQPPSDELEQAGSSGPRAAWRTAKRLAAGAIAVAMLAGAFLLGGGGNGWNGGRDGLQRGGDGGTVAHPTTAAGTNSMAPLNTPPTPRVTAVSLAAGGPFKAGDDVGIDVTFSRPVRVTGRPRIEFNVGGESTRREALLVGGEGTDRLSFRFEVPTGSIDGTGIRLASPPSIDPAGGGIADAATGEAADLVLEPPAAFAAVRIDGVAPRVGEVTPPTGTADRSPGDRLEFRVEFDEAVVVEGKPTLSFRVGRSSRQAKFTGAADRMLMFTSTVTAADQSDDGVTVTEVVLGGGVIRDAVGNAADLAFAPQKSAGFAIKASADGRPKQPPDPVKSTDAEALAKAAIEDARREKGPNHPDTAASLAALAAVYADRSRYDEAADLWSQALRIFEPTLGPGHPTTADCLYNLGWLSLTRSQESDALPLLTRALQIYEKAFGPDHPSTAKSLRSLGWLHVAQARETEAEPLLSRALSICEEALGPEHPETAKCRYFLAVLHLKSGKDAVAEPILERALASFEKALGPDDPRTRDTRATLAALRAKRSQASESP